MTKEDLQLSIAEMGYDIGFGAKKHFATHDIVDKIPGVIGFISTAVAIFSLVMDALSTKQLSATFTVLGVMVLVIGRYDHKKVQYAEAGQKLTELFNASPTKLVGRLRPVKSLCT